MTDCVTDTESYRNYWLCAFESGEDVEMWNGAYYVNGFTATRQQFLDVLYASLQGRTLVTFNGIWYDLPMISLALKGATSEELKAANNVLIPPKPLKGPAPWEFAEMYGTDRLEWVDHIDMMEVAPGDGSLKSYTARMHLRRLQDLPVELDAYIDATQRELLRSYCKGSDIPATRGLRDELDAQIRLRIDMSAEYGIDLRSKSDAQIAESVMKKTLTFKVPKNRIAYDAPFNFRAASWVKFHNPRLQLLLHQLCSVPFRINKNGSPAPDPAHTFIDWGDKQERCSAQGAWGTKPKEWKHDLIQIGNATYSVGIGGLHSTESATMHVADAAHMISDHDVASYYPSLIIRTGIYPQQIGPVFLEIYGGWYHRRIEAKRAGIKKTANSLKTLLNGTFGKLGSPWSIFYAPSEMIQVTITGQLALLMLIERLELAGIAVISANTDGIVLKTPRHLIGTRDAVIALWQYETGLETEANEYRLLASRDVNSYMAIKPDGEVKTKGDYADPVPGASGWPNPKRQICVDAIASWLRDGVPVSQTIRACRDIRQFICMIKVTGGGSLCPDGALPAKTTQKAMRALCGESLKGADLVAAYEYMRAGEQVRREYLGKTVRWYYAQGSRACIVTPKGGHVRRTEGCRPVMELPDAFPDDIDYEWYEREAADMLRDMGC